MKKLLLLTIGTSLVGIMAAQSIPDGTFEFWNATTWNDPVYYQTSNDQGVPNGLPANVTQTTGYHGVYGVKLETVGTSPNIQAGFIINGNPNKNTITGGIPYSQEPTGIRFYYQYTPVSGDIAAVLVIFKKLGTAIDSFLVTLPTAAGSYTLHSYYKSVSNFPIAPDTVVFGAVSSLAAITSGGGNAGSTLIIDSVTFTGVSSQPADMNGDFENWTTDTLLTPSKWYINYPNVTRTKDAASGTYAMQVETENTPGNGIQVGQAGTGYYTNCNSNCNELGGDVYALTPSGKDTLEFDYKYAPEPNDTANISLNFIKNGQAVSFTGISLLAASAYTYTTIPFNLSGVTPVPDTVIVNITSSAHNHDTSSAQNAPYVGSIFKIDNLTFASQKTYLGINAISATEGIRTFPVPAKNQINVDLTNVAGSLERLTIYDMSGRILSAQSYSSGGVRNTLETIDVSNFSTGIYLIEATTSNGNFYQKVVKE